tara:strand:+ start:11330 stop:11788 length:459 start_codon:yes stop_codon:yes gene_type:complete
MKKLHLALTAATLMFSSVATAMHTYELTYFATSQHIDSVIHHGEYYGQEHNKNHKFIGLEYRTGNTGYAISTFMNSYYKRSYLVDYVQYWQPWDNIELSARGGVATGYDKSYNIGPLIPFGSMGVAYTANKNFIPKLSFAPGVFVLSFSMRF